MIAVLDIHEIDGSVLRRTWRRFPRERRQRAKASQWALERLARYLEAGIEPDRFVVAVLPEEAASRVKDADGAPSFSREA